MRKPDLTSGIFFLLFGIFVISYSPRFDLGTLNRPGSGFMPFLSGLLICTFSILILIQSWFKKSEVVEKVWVEVNFLKIVLAILILTVYGLLINRLGFLVSSFFLILTLMHYIGSSTWRMSLLAAFLVSAIAYLLFGIWLKVPLPKGMFGF